MSTNSAMRAYLCDCDPAARHRPDRPSSPILIDVMLATMFNPWHNPPMPLRFWGTWQCVVHGRLGDINGPVHYEVCGNRPDYEYLTAMLKWPDIDLPEITVKTWLPGDPE